MTEIYYLRLDEGEKCFGLKTLVPVPLTFVGRLTNYDTILILF